MKRVLMLTSLLVCLGISKPMVGQILVQPAQKERLMTLSAELKAQNEVQRKEIAILAAKSGLPLSYEDNQGRRYHLVGVDPLGLPQYRYLHSNANSAITIGADALYADGSTGYNLSGAGMTVHVWDGGMVRATHEDFEGRVVNQTSFTMSNHATHVTGTILGGGVNDVETRGIAYQANAEAYYFGDNDLQTMAELAATGDLLVSNHSYGLVLGWGINGSGEVTWFGPGGVAEDYRFGYYSAGESAVIDEIAYNAPYYTIVWSAGNDRDDAGDDSHLADGPDDCIGPEGTSKNNLAVGAVTQVLNYTGPQNVTMSGFSSWGPVDDGRVKPDVVAMGVNVRSTGSGGDRTYSTLSGTSMSAPAVTGGITLLQELHGRENGQFMTSAMVKALVNHTAREAGKPGPDYSYGWGLVDLETAADVIVKKNAVDTMMIMDTLRPGEVHEYEIFASGIAPLKATMAWTDVPGTPVEPTIDDRTPMLVNDLDMRIVTTSGSQEHFPFILDPENPNDAATQGDNFRDNVEQVLISNPESRSYTLRISHKGNDLSGGEQVYSLVVTTEGAPIPDDVFYLVGADLEDAASWSSTSGGAPAVNGPTVNSTLIIDENSSQAALDLGLTTQFTANNLFVYGTNPVSINLNGQNLNLAGGLRVNNPDAQLLGGTLNFTGGVGNHEVFLGGADLSGIEMIFSQPNAAWDIISDGLVGGLVIEEGAVSLSGAAVEVDHLEIANNGRLKSLMLDEATLTISNQLLFADATDYPFIDLASGTLIFNGDAATLQAPGYTFEGLLEVAGGNLAVQSEGITISSLGLNAGTLSLPNNTKVLAFACTGGATLELAAGGVHHFTSDFQVSAAANNLFTIQSSGASIAEFQIPTFSKLCLDHVAVDAVDNTGMAIISLGEGGAVANGANGWQLVTCENVLFPAYEVQYPCSEGYTIFKDQSSGGPEGYLWDFGESVAGNTSEDASPVYSYGAPGKFNVTLTVSRGGDQVVYSDTLEIIQNSLNQPTLIASGETGLASATSAGAYQWLMNGDSIEGATNRSYNHGGVGGDYQVVISDGTCARASEPFTVIDEVTGLELPQLEVEIWPNPVSGTLYVKIPDSEPFVEATLLTSQGKVVRNAIIEQGQGQLSVVGLPSGMYVIQFVGDKAVATRPIMVE